MKQRFLVVAALLSLFAATAAWAHHSLAAEYDQKKPVSLSGTVTKLDWRNPHAWVYVEVKNASGAVDKWQCELGSPNAMTRAGFSPDSLKSGDEVTLDGIVAKDGSNTCSTRVIKSKDGRTLLSQTEAR